MIMDLPPQTSQEAIALSKPRVEVVAEDSTKKDMVVGAGIGLFIGNEAVLNPTFNFGLTNAGLSHIIWADNGFVGTPKMNGSQIEPYIESFTNYDINGFLIRPSVQLEASRHHGAARLGLTTKPLRIGRFEGTLDVYPLSTADNDDGQMETEVIARGEVNLGKGFSLTGMGRMFSNIGGKVDAAHLGKIGVSYRKGESPYSFHIEYRNWPTLREEMAERQNRGYLFAGCKYRL